MHLFKVYGYQGGENEPGKLRLTDRMLKAVLLEAGVSCAGQPVMIVGGTNALSTAFPCVAKSIAFGYWTDEGEDSMLPAGSIWMKVKVPGGTVPWPSLPVLSARSWSTEDTRLILVYCVSLLSLLGHRRAVPQALFLWPLLAGSLPLIVQVLLRLQLFKTSGCSR